MINGCPRTPFVRCALAAHVALWLLCVVPAESHPPPHSRNCSWLAIPKHNKRFVVGCDASTSGKADNGESCGGLALAQAVLDDLAGLWRDPVGEEHLELHHQVASLARALGHGQALAPQPPDSTWLDDVAARQRHHPVVKCWDVNCEAAESLGVEEK